MVSTEEKAAPPKHLNVRQAAIIGMGAIVGAGIFALLSAAASVAGAAVWKRRPAYGSQTGGRDMAVQADTRGQPPTARQGAS